MTSIQKPLITKEEVSKCIPQKDPIIMVDSLLSCDEESSTTSLKIRSDNIFCKDSNLDEVGIIEHIAQSLALASFYKGKEADKAPEIGFIGSVDNFNLYSKAKLGDTLITKINIIERFMNIVLIQAQVFVDDALIAECKMKVAMSGREVAIDRAFH